ncbi:MAG: hypothetical protein LBS12_01145 [Prevotellaceae bacterium]|jgi:Leucine-rich repeat (LRR) protein|nr:hypothetical protein [Prevotellaceae bacterium]
MKKIILSFALCLLLSPVFGQSRVVQVEQLSASYGAAPTVTFRVYWTTPPVGPRHRSNVWLFVDYLQVFDDGTTGAWTPATISSVVSVSDGTASYPVALPYRGFYLQGNASAAFSSTVTVALDGLADAKFSWCAYASDYPPNATEATGYYALHGAPPFTINTSITEATKQYAGGCITALTDATGCPGIPPAMPAVTSFIATPDTICAGDTITLTATATGATSYSFNGEAWTTNNAATFSPTTTTEYTIHIKNIAGCTATAAPTTVTVHPRPVAAFVNPPATACAGGSVTLTASGGGSYCFTQECLNCIRNPYTTGNDSLGAGHCYSFVQPCTYTDDDTYSFVMPESGSVTVCVKVITEHGCLDSICTTIGSVPAPTMAIVTTEGAADQTIPLGQPLATIKYTTTDVTTVTVEDLPAGLNYTWNAPTVEIFGSAAASATVGTHTYTVTAVGPCGTVTATGVITITGELFSMTTNNTGNVFFTANFGDIMYIDWGDNTGTYTTGDGSKAHTFAGGTTPPYTVTAQATAITRLSSLNSKLTALDVTQCSALTYLDCSSNQLPALDVSNNTALRELNCSSNSLTALDVRQNTVLRILRCNNNQLSTLDVTQNTALNYLYCHYNNQLTALYVSPCTALRELSCSNNKLTELNLPQSTALTSLSCGDNQLPSLDVSANTALTSLACGNNKLSALNVSANTALTTLYCYSNPLYSLDVSSNDKLIYLYCYNDSLLSLTLPQTTTLKTLQCYNNQLPSLNVSANTALTALYCHNNLLPSLNVSANTALTTLDCNNNQLSSLTLPQSTALTALYCHDNQLSSLNVSANTALAYLNCNNNQLPSLDVSANTALISLNCNNNQLPSLNVSANTALTNLEARSNLFTAAELDALFYTLHNNSGSKWIYIKDNPKAGSSGYGTPGDGTANCNQNIATGKGWSVNTTN